MKEKALAAYAVSSSEGREFSELRDPTRTEFQRDRDRIIHSKAFRRLSGKTQVFVATYGDHFRDRLTHTLEVAQVARDMARSLRLNEDLCEAVALAHDLGHPPFGHAGEATLNGIMKKFGGHFEHNEQSQRIVEVLEKQFPNFDGLNLTHEVREGLAKHQTLYDQQTKKIRGKTLEAQVVDLADEIAYHNHDLDDGLRSRLFSLKDVRALSLWCDAEMIVFEKYGALGAAQRRRAGFGERARASPRLASEPKSSLQINPVVLRHRCVSAIVSLMISDVLQEAAKNIKKRRIRSLKNVLEQKNNAVCFSAPFQKKVSELRAFLWKCMYQSPRVLRYSRRGQRILERLFWKLMKRPKLMPKRFLERIDAPDRLEVVVKDYVAGCTDRYATQIYN